MGATGAEGAPVGSQDLGLRSRAAGVGQTAGGALRLLGRAVVPVLRTAAAGFGLLMVLVVPLWIWANAMVTAIDLSDGEHLTRAKIVELIVLIGLPAAAVLVAVGLATFGAVTIVLDDVSAN